MLARRSRLFILGVWMSFPELRLGPGKKIRRRCGHLCGRCGSSTGEWIKYGDGFENHESQNREFWRIWPQAERDKHLARGGARATRAGAVWCLRRAVCA